MAPLADREYSRGTTIYLRVFVPEAEEVTNEFGEIVTPPTEYDYSQGLPEDEVPGTPEGVVEY